MTLHAWMWKGLLAGGLVCLAGAPVRAETCYTPKGFERKEILDALRVPVEGSLNQTVEFVVTSIKVCWKDQPVWAFVDAKPQRPGGGSLDWAGAGFDDCSETVEGLLRRDQAGLWQVIESPVCPTDVPWSAWTDQYGAPPALFR